MRAVSIHSLQSDLCAVSPFCVSSMEYFKILYVKSQFLNLIMMIIFIHPRQDIAKKYIDPLHFPIESKRSARSSALSKMLGSKQIFQPECLRFCILIIKLCDLLLSGEFFQLCFILHSFVLTHSFVSLDMGFHSQIVCNQIFIENLFTSCINHGLAGLEWLSRFCVLRCCCCLFQLSKLSAVPDVSLLEE